VTDEAVGRRVEPDDPWVAAKKEMYPSASLSRIAANAKFTIATISLVGTALTALGLVTAASVKTNRDARILAIVAAAIALLAVVAALSYLAVRLERRNYENYVEVRRWYNRQFKRAWLVVVASWLLIAAVLVASVAGLIVALSVSNADVPVLSLIVKGTGEKRSVTAGVSVSRLDPGDVVTWQVTGDTGQVLATGKTATDSTGAARVEATFDDTTNTRRYRLTVRVGDRDRGSVEVP
jgi:hypothetical protein